MKTSAILVTAAAGLAMAQAPLPSSFPPCGVTCITNMLGLANSFGCTPDNAQCLCSQINFVYGVRDCADQACPGGASGTDALTVKSFGVNYCYQAGVAISGIPASIVASGSPTTTLFATNSPGPATSGRPSNSVTGSGAPVVTTIVSTLTNAAGSPTGTTTIVSTLNGGGAGAGGSASATGAPSGSAGVTGSAGAGASSAISTIPIVTTITSGGSTFTSIVGSSTIFAGGAAGASAISTVPIVSTITSGGSTIVTTIGSSTIFASGSGGSAGASATVSNSVTVVTSGGSTFTTSVPVTQSQSSGGAGGASSSTSRAMAPQQTAAPVGFIAAAGLAALLL